MGIVQQSMIARRVLRGRSFFLSASIPDPARWNGEFDAMQITDAVVSVARAVFYAGGRLVTAAHPTVAPLLLYTAAEFPPQEEQPLVDVYQSRLFKNVLPRATRRFEEHGTGRLIWTEEAEGDEPVPGKWEQSLSVMRESMLRTSRPVAAVFIGGMEGITEEHSLFRRLFPLKRTYAVGRPGGEAAALANRHHGPLREDLRESFVYPQLFREVVADVATWLDAHG